jgi:hypothetical protein
MCVIVEAHLLIYLLRHDFCFAFAAVFSKMYTTDWITTAEELTGGNTALNMYKRES